MSLLRLRAVLAGLGRLLPTMRPRTWIFLALPLCLSLALIVSVGGNIQHAIVTAVSSDAPTIYDAAYSGGVITWYRLIDWFFYSFHPLYLALAAVVTLSALWAKTYKSMLVVIAVGFAIVLTIADVILEPFSKDFRLSDHILNVPANIVGGAAIALIVSLGLAAFKFVLRNLPIQYGLAYGAAAAALLTVGALTNLTAYYALKFLYEPRQADVSLLLDEPLTGFVAYSWQTDNAPESEDGEASNYFDFLPEAGRSGSISVENHRSPIVGDWIRNDQARSYVAQVRLLRDCAFVQIDDLPDAAAVISERDADRVSISTDTGGSILSAQTIGLHDFAWKPAAPSRIWLDRAANDGAFRVTHFAGPDDRLSMANSGRVDVAVSVIFLKTQGEAYNRGSRSIRVTIDDRTIDFHLNPGSATDERRSCEAASFTSSGSGEFRADLQGDFDGTVLLTLKPEPSNIFYPRESEFTVRRGSGWFSVRDIAPDDLSSGIGDLTLISARGSAAQLLVDGQSVPVRPDQEIYLLGQLRANLLEEGRARITGSRVTVGVDGVRQNMTRWERLATEWQLGLLGALVTLILGAAAWLWPKLAPLENEDVRSWLP